MWVRLFEATHFGVRVLLGSPKGTNRFSSICWNDFVFSCSDFFTFCFYTEQKSTWKIRVCPFRFLPGAPPFLLICRESHQKTGTLKKRDTQILQIHFARVQLHSAISRINSGRHEGYFTILVYSKESQQFHSPKNTVDGQLLRHFEIMVETC